MPDVTARFFADAIKTVDEADAADAVEREGA
jgi:hypothetical protein